MTWPLLGLRLRHDGLLLRPVTEADLDDVVRVLPADVDLDPTLPADRAAAVHQGYWRAMGSWNAAAWVLSLLVLRDGELVGVQTLEGTDFPLLRTVDTASWLVPSARGQGVGKAMRAAVLGLAFGPLEAEAAVTSALATNASSLGVSRALGYRPNGEHFFRQDDRREVLVHLRMLRAAWSWAPVEVDGFAECRSLFGL